MLRWGIDVLGSTQLTEPVAASTGRVSLLEPAGYYASNLGSLANKAADTIIKAVAVNKDAV